MNSQHIRYDLKNNFSTSFKTHCNYFLERCDCTFAFFWQDFSITFDVKKVLEVADYSQSFTVTFSIAELYDKEQHLYATVDPKTDSRLKDIGFISDLFNGTVFLCNKKTKEEVHDFITYMTSCFKRIRKMSALA